MNFIVKPRISDCSGLDVFFEQWSVGKSDLIITNEYVLNPQLGGKPAPCDTLFQEKYGQGEPSDEMVNAMLTSIGGKDYKRIIAIGGGTVIDIAKLFVFGAGHDCDAIFANAESLRRERSLIIIPTTCGTGSEVTSISIVEFKKKHTKLGLNFPALFADETVLIPSMLNTLPYEVFATSSIDALIHAVESYVSPKATFFSRAMGRSAIELILGGYKKMAEKGERKLPENMEDFLFASTLAGIAFGNAGCAAVHALSYPIGGGYHVPHGKANYMVFEKVFQAYKSKKADVSEVEKVLSGIFGCPVEKVWTALFELISKIYDNQTLSKLGADAAKCAEMSEIVIKTQQRLLNNNPIPLSVEDICEIYRSCL
jgi:4-hydroxybutyrate dehydrogenase